jgi:hypothetical protein
LEYFYKYGTADTLTQEIFNFFCPPPEGSEMQDGAHFTATRLVRAGIL